MCLVYAKITTLIVLLLLRCSLPHANLFSLYWLTCALHPSSLSEWRSTCSRSSRTASNLFDILRVSSSKLEWTVGGASMPLQNYRQMYQPGHFCSLHLLSSSLSPLQSLPPGPGGGLLQLRVLFWVPPPHVLLQLLQRVQSLQFPSTTKNVWIFMDTRAMIFRTMVASCGQAEEDMIYFILPLGSLSFQRSNFFIFLLYLVLGMNSGLEASRQLWYHQILLLAAHQTAKYIVI